MISRRKRLHELQRRIVTAGCLVSIVLLMTGIPVRPACRKDLSSPFPCMESHCGCMTAEQCWRNCCCHTLEEKLAWARHHGVTPPGYVLEQIACYDSDAEESGSPSCCCSENQAVSKECCQEQHQAATTTDVPVTWKWINTLQAMKCHGQNGWSLLANALVVVMPSISLTAVDAERSERLQVDEQHIDSRTSPPELPPPRFHSV